MKNRTPVKNPFPLSDRWAWPRRRRGPLIAFASLGTSPVAWIDGLYPLTSFASLTNLALQVGDLIPKGEGNSSFLREERPARQGLAEEGILARRGTLIRVDRP